MRSLTMRLIFVLVAGAFLFVFGSNVRAQDPPPTNPVLEKTNVVEGAAPLDAGGSGRSSTHAADLSTAQQERARERVRSNIAKLRAEGKLPAPDSTQQVLFRWPLSTTLSDFGYHGISNYVDHDATFPNHLLDYNTGTRTYDLDTGYNHQGTDIFGWPFPWNKMDSKVIKVVAAAAGTIADKQDENYDRSCSWVGTGDANYVILTHNDGSESWYWHLKNGSVTKKGIGQAVAAGEQLGIMGSSGFSTGPHLHFEVYNAADSLIDPWVGPSNPTTGTSWWQSQKPYYDPGINVLTTGFAAPDNPNCDNETPNSANAFDPGDTIYFTTYFRDQLANAQTQYKILRPNGTTFTSWNFSDATYYPASWWWWSYNIPSNEAQGIWTFRATYQSQDYDKTFQVGVCPVVPNKPALVSPANNATVASKALLDWSDALCASTYNLQVRQDSKTGAVKVNKTGLTKSQFKVKNLTPGKTYFWRVTAVNSQGSTKSAWRRFQVQ